MTVQTNPPATIGGRNMPVSDQGSRRETPAQLSVWTSGQELGVISMTIRYKTYVAFKSVASVNVAGENWGGQGGDIGDDE